jgi:hypothetical protein
VSDPRFDAGSGLRAALAFAALALAVGITGMIEPDVRAAQERVEDARLTLRSDAIAFANAERLRAERSRLSARFARTFEIDPQAQILRRLSAALQRHGVTFTSTQNGAVVPAATSGARTEFEDVRLSLELRGSYRGVLMVMDELARDCELARVDSASLHRAGDGLSARLAIALLRPAAVTPRTAAASGGG